MKKKFHSCSVMASKNQYDLPEDFIFIHIPKTGGMSVRSALRARGKRIPGPHKSVRAYQELYGSDIFREYKGYAVIRNPLDRLVSAYFYVRGRFNSDSYDNKRERELFSNEFSAFIEELFHNHDRYFKELLIVMPQHCMVAGLDGVIPVELHPFDNLAEFLSMVSKRYFDASLEPVHLNRTKHTHFMDYYNDETRAMVLEMYKDDVLLYESLCVDILNRHLDMNPTNM